METFINDYTFVDGKPIHEYLQKKIDERVLGETFTLSELLDSRFDGNLNTLGRCFLEWVKTNQFEHVEFIGVRNNGVAEYKRTDIKTPFIISRSVG